ncbi:MAG TPA: glycosyltransferase [Trebonia sp.]|nr:glycosyltransferase [Trebonia sp.]
MSFLPVKVCEVELSEPVSGITAPGHESALVLARWYSEPLAVVDIPLQDGSADAGQVARALWSSVEQQVKARCPAAGMPVTASPVPVAAGLAGTGGNSSAAAGADGGAQALADGGLQLPWPPQYLLGRATTLLNAPPASVVICTRDRTERLGSCLAAVLRQDYPDFEVIVVDNAPTDDAVGELVGCLRAAGTNGVPLRHVVEQRPGLSWARNTGLQAASGRIVAYLDDDEHPDRHWLAELARGFTLGDGVVGVSGLVLPAVLDTPAQRLYEQFGGHSKGRGLTAEVFDVASHARQHPLYPLPAFGVGASMAFDREALLRIGGFDVALGAGTPARAGEDTAAIGDLMLDGGTFVYWPGAVMWHEHRKEFAEVERQLDGYGSGLTAFYTRAVLRDPRRLLTLARLAPRAVRDLRGGKDSVRTATMTESYPATLRRASVKGMLSGPFRYLRSRRAQARVSARASRPEVSAPLRAAA